jgi:ABC-type transport system involved in multi-copper enzyme maturation permease subunit
MTSLIAIIDKELRLTMRNRRTAIMLFVVLAICAVAFLNIWGFDRSIDLPLESRATIARTAFYLMWRSQNQMLGLVTALMAIWSIEDERLGRTLALLFCSGLSTRQLVVGKWLAALAFQGVLLLALLPMEVLVFSLGGVGPAEFFIALLNLIRIIALAGAIAMARVSLRPGTFIPLITAGIILLMWTIFNSTLTGIFSIPFLNLMNPATSGVSGLVQAIIMGVSVLLDGWFIWWNLKVSARALIVFDREALPFFPPLPQPPREVGRSLYRRAVAVFFPRDFRGDWLERMNPVFIKENRNGGYDAERQFGLCCAIVVLVSLPRTIFQELHYLDLTQQLRGCALMIIMVCGLICTPQAATSVCSEREGRTLDLLLAAPLSARSIVRGKLWCVLRTFVLIWIVTLAAVLLFKLSRIVVGEPFAPWAFLKAALVSGLPFLVHVFFFGCLMICISSLHRHNRGAILSAYVTLGAVWGALSLLDDSLGQMVGEGRPLTRAALRIAKPFAYDTGELSLGRAPVLLGSLLGLLVTVLVGVLLYSRAARALERPELRGGAAA